MTAIDARVVSTAGPAANALEAVVSWRVLPRLALVGLRVAPGSRAERDVAAALGSDLPEATRNVPVADGIVLWVGPDEWLFIGAPGSSSTTVAILERALGAEGVALDVSSARATLELVGRGSCDVLATCCPLDLHPRSFGVDSVAGTLVGGVPAVVHRTADGAGFWIHAPSSSVAHVTDWLVAGIESVRAAAALEGCDERRSLVDPVPVRTGDRVD